MALSGLTLTNFRTGSSPDLRLYLNEGALVKNTDDAWTTDGGDHYEVAFVESAGTQEFEIRDTGLMPENHSVTVAEYPGLDFGSAALE